MDGYLDFAPYFSSRRHSLEEEAAQAIYIIILIIPYTTLLSFHRRRNLDLATVGVMWQI